MTEDDTAVYPSKQDGHSAGFCQTNDVFSAESLHLLAKIRGEADRPALRDRRVHELADGGEDGGDGFIVDGELFVEPGFELCKSARQFLVGREHLAQLHEGAHDPDVDGDRAVAFEHGRQHGDSLLCESVGSVATAAALGV